VVRIVVFRRETALPYEWGSVVAVLAGALLLSWPGLWNGYPILFSDTHAFLVQAGQPRMVWDKPWIYGPFLRVLHVDTSLWGPLAGQAFLMSYLLFLAARVLGRPGPWRHLAVCAVLATASTAPWFVSLLMPDLFAPATVLCLLVLSQPEQLSRTECTVVAAIGAVAVASHLSHLPLAAAMVAVLAMQRRRVWLAALPLAAALCLLLASNLVGFGRFAVSPYGSVFMLARLVADGPAADTIRAECPQAGWRMCGWVDRLPADSDDFMWDGKGPVWSDPAGPTGLAPEAGAIVRRTLVRAPWQVASGMAGNTWRQVFRLQLGDTLGPDWLESSVLGSLHAYFPPAETRRFYAGRQMQGTLKPVGTALNVLDACVLAAAFLATAVLAVRRRGMSGFAMLVLCALLVNAAVTGGLSRPNDRYQARIAWLLLLPPLFAVPDLQRGFYRRALRAA
jgi:hypothetical protein